MPSTSRDTTKAGVTVDIYFMRCAVIFNVIAMHTSRWLELIGRSQPTRTAIVRLHGSMGARRSRANADDRLPRASLGRVEGGDGIREGRDGADVRPQSSVPHPLDDVTPLGTMGLDNEVDRQPVDGPRLGRPDDGH